MPVSTLFPFASVVCNHKCLFDLRALNIYMYFIMAYEATVGVKHGRLYWLAIYRWMQTKGGLTKVLKHTFLDIFGGNKKPVSIKRRNRNRQ
uniref:Uncharacterized protein n=1 Tax=Aegilops tauschii subsp. strangulata TaxID=200361 RepID=A0A453DAC7_AEGTS